MGAWMKPIGAPFPDVPTGVVEAVCVGGKLIHGTSAQIAVVERVLGGKPSLPDVHHVVTVRFSLVSPRVALLHEPAPRRVLPLGLGRQPKPRPLAKRLCVM